jgi:hypothetical protein
MGSWPKQNCSKLNYKKHGSKPNLSFYSVVTNNETNSMTTNTTQLIRSMFGTPRVIKQNSKSHFFHNLKFS